METIKAKIGEPTGAKFFGKSVRSVTFKANPAAVRWASFRIDGEGATYVLLEKVSSLGDSDTFLCYQAHTPEEEWDIKRKLVARSKPHASMRRKR